MSPATWSWIAAAASIVGLWISGHNPRVGWIYGIASQAVWIAYGLATTQPGMIALSIAFVVIYSRNIYRWRGTRFQRAAAAQPLPTSTDGQP
ncbi:hypothetical protein AB0H28_29265 [Micromonospora sp. NPDC050980]|uniref:hypothetical protein n=1 Tax=Micromonospora sp. NPDC050980 TaxID=3155161 RepID=UPI0033D89E80